MKMELHELKKRVEPKKSGFVIPDTPEVLRCCEELKVAQERARQHLLDSEVSEAEVKKHEHEGFICDPVVVEACHNRLRAFWNSVNPYQSPVKITYLFDEELQSCL
jgi:hypothetical protein